MFSGLGLVNRLCAILGLKSVATLVCADRCPLASVWFFLHPNLDKDLNHSVIRITQKLKETGKFEEAEKFDKARPWCVVGKSLCQCTCYFCREMLVGTTQPYRCAYQG